MDRVPVMVIGGYNSSTFTVSITRDYTNNAFNSICWSIIRLLCLCWVGCHYEVVDIGNLIIIEVRIAAVLGQTSSGSIQRVFS
jgi:hypothetical protein